ncbi:MAG: ABC transporter ATP-binding protein [Crenarchaeota archaeon]|nr:ABC transporter ATP-binding protein [Thermoproteota archaeon]
MILKICDLRVYYFLRDKVVRAIDKIDLEVPEGVVFGIVGESGSGKSTLAHAIIRLIPPPGRIVSGSIFFRDLDLVKLSEKELNKIRGNRITMIPQDPISSFNPTVRIGDQLLDVAIHKLGLSRREAAKIIIEKLKLVRMPSPEINMRKYPHELSGGMLQRAAIAMALLPDPDLIIADEPTTALDVTIQAAILKLIRDLVDDLKKTVILITHNMGIVAETCDKIAVMYAGQIVELGDVYDMLSEPLHPYTRALIMAVPRADREIERLEPLVGEPPSLSDIPRGCRFHPRCRLAKPICKREEPPLRYLDSKRAVRCWLYV